MRRSREEGDDDDANIKHATDITATAASSKPVVPTITHPSRYFVPYTGRYYIHFLMRNAKGMTGHNLRFMLHSNGLCVLSLDPTNLLVQSYYNLLDSCNNNNNNNKKSGLFEAIKSGKKKLLEAITDEENSFLCTAFHHHDRSEAQPQGEKSLGSQCPGASTAEQYTCSNTDDLYRLICEDKIAVLPAYISHTINGTRGQRNRIEANTKMSGKRKKGASYVQEATTLCFAFLETFVKCPRCKKWQMMRPSHEKSSAAAAGAEESSSHSATGRHQHNKQHQQQNLSEAYVKNENAIVVPNSPGCALRIPPRQQQQREDGAAAAAAAAGKIAENEQQKSTDNNEDNNPSTSTSAPALSFYLPKLIKIPISVNGIMLDVNDAVNGLEGAELAAKDPLGGGFLVVLKPRSDVSFTEKFQRVGNATPMVSPSEEVRPFVADSFTGALDF